MLAAAARQGADFQPAQIKRIQVRGKCAARPKSATRSACPAYAAGVCPQTSLGQPTGGWQHSAWARGAAVGGPAADLPADAAALVQAAREERLVVLLGALLRRYVEGDALGFRASWGAAHGRTGPCSACCAVPAIDTMAAQAVCCCCCCRCCCCCCRCCWWCCCWMSCIAQHPLHVLMLPPPRLPLRSPPPWHCLQESMAVEAAELATASFGDVMLKAIGKVYESQADIFLGGFIDGTLAALRWAGCQQPEGVGHWRARLALVAAASHVAQDPMARCYPSCAVVLTCAHAFHGFNCAEPRGRA